MLVDLDMPAEGQPSIAWPRGAIPSRPVFIVVTPPGGGEEDARLFAVCVDGSLEPASAPFHKGPRPKALPVTGIALETVDPEVVARLFERGDHPGDLLIVGGQPDRYGRPEIAVLAFMNLSQGFDHGDKLSTPNETRIGLAFACASIGDPSWDAAANLFDPAGLVRSGAVQPLGGNPMTEEGFHRYMLDRNAALNVDCHPMNDFRSLSDAELANELAADARATVYGNPDLGRDHSGARLLREDIPQLVDAFRGRTDVSRALDTVRRRLLETVSDSGSNPAVERLVSGIGSGAACWRNLFSPDGLLDIVETRGEEPGCHNDIISAVTALPDWAQRAFRDPAEILRHRPRSLRHVPGILADPYRPYLSLPIRRIAASPGLKGSVASVEDGRLTELLDGTELLIGSFDRIPNACTLATEARGALAVGWRVLAREVVRRSPDEATSLAERDPGLPDDAARLPYMAGVIGARQPPIIAR